MNLTKSLVPMVITVVVTVVIIEGYHNAESSAKTPGDGASVSSVWHSTEREPFMVPRAPLTDQVTVASS
jgi:hypothetical protein